MRRVLNFGSLNVDHVYGVDHFVAPGETLSTSRYQIFPGGKGLNQSIALARAGAQVSHAGKIGPDGVFLTALLRENGVDVSAVPATGSATGHAIIQVDRSGQNCILLHGGANEEISDADIRRTLAGFGPGDLLVLQNEISEISSILAQAHARGMEIALNPSPMDARISGYPLELVTWFLLNEVEGHALTRETDPDQIALSLLCQWPEAKVVLTLGGAGVLYRDAAQRLTHPIFPVHAIDTTAAGDTFTGYFLGGILRGDTLPDCLRLASSAAALAVSRRGAAVSIPQRAEVVEFLAQWDSTQS